MLIHFCWSAQCGKSVEASPLHLVFLPFSAQDRTWKWYFYLTRLWVSEEPKSGRLWMDNLLPASAIQGQSLHWKKSFSFYWNLFLIDFLPICSVFFLTFLTLQDFRMHLTATGKLGRSLTIIIKTDQMMLFWLTNSWYKQATEQSPLTSARYCIRVHTGLYRNAQVIRSGERWKKHVIVPFSSLRIEIPQLHHSVWSCWLW